MPRLLVFPTLLIPLALACGAPASDASDEGGGAAPEHAGEPAAGGESATGTPAPRAPERPATVTDTLSLEGTPEPIRMDLFRAPEGFPLRFSAYVPEEMAVEVSTEESGSSVHFYAEFGGTRNDLAFVHVFVYPPDTDLNAAMGVVRGYKAGRGVPVSQGLEPLDEQGRADRMPWAKRGFRFEYQAGGQWFVGSIGLGTRNDRIFHVIRHYPAEYGDGFGPRAALLMDSWRWRDGTPLEAGS